MMSGNRNIARNVGLLLLLAGAAGRLPAAEPAAVPPYDTEPALFNSRPGPQAEMHFGHVGVTGLKVRVYPGVTLKVEETVPGTPAAGKFAKGDVITGINGVALQGRNPFVALGEALTAAEAQDGRLVFDVRPAAGQATNQVTVVIPVLGAYSPTWPLDCRKSQAIVAGAAAYYARTLKYAGGSAGDLESERESHGIGGALACLFLLSTGDDQYLPRVKSYFDELARNIPGIGDNTWNNGYNGIACAEYFLRTGDASVLPVLQYYCDDARDRQYYGIGWGHWGRQVNPGYVAGGLMNPAGAQVATTLLLARECGANVDEPTLTGALTFFYRFAGHGGVAYGDHRGEGGLGSNGKDGMVAAIMQAACGAKGNVDAYRSARDSLGLAMLDSYPCLVTGHADNGRGDAIWRGIASAYVLEFSPADYRATMQRLQWWYDLSRRPSGALGAATCQRFDDEGTGAGVALSYTAPLRTLRITGAPRARHAKEFRLPKRPWGRKADLAFLAVEHGRPYRRSGTNEPVHVAYHQLGNAYSAPENMARAPRADLVRNVYHRNYLIRTQAAKALMHTGAFAELEALMRDKDPRVRRAAVDALTDYRYWHVMGKQPIRAEDVSPAMLASIRQMLADPDEAVYVVDGALLALSCAPAKAVGESLPLILPWTTCDEWWVRSAAFLALAVAARDEPLAATIVPTLVAMLLREQRPHAREMMAHRLAGLLAAYPPASGVGREIVAAFKRAAAETEIKAGPRAGEGGYNVLEAANACLKADPATAPDVARIIKSRFEQLGTGQLSKVIDALLSVRGTLPDGAREELAGILYADYRQELIRRMQAGEQPLDPILSLTQLRNPGAGWQEVGTPAAAERVCRFTSFEAQGADVLEPRDKRFRDVALPAGLEQWYRPEFDASGWAGGPGPVGKGVFKPRGNGTVFANRSSWGEGEFLLLRSEFELAAVDCDYYRIAILANRGYHIFLNGQRIHTYIWWQGAPMYRSIWLGGDDAKRLRPGTNLLAVYANADYPGGTPIGQLDIRLEGLRKADLLQVAQR